MLDCLIVWRSLLGHGPTLKTHPSLSLKWAGNKSYDLYSPRLEKKSVIYNLSACVHIKKRKG